MILAGQAGEASVKEPQRCLQGIPPPPVDLEVTFEVVGHHQRLQE